jgi:hypothetical protein
MPRRMAFRLRLLLTTVWIIATSHLAAAATPFNLSSEVTAFIPSCARDCFLSFLSVNYAPITCGTSPGLQCLCAKEGVSGYTIGEGALQCIVAENSIGFCKGYDVGCKFYLGCVDLMLGRKLIVRIAAVVQRAYLMCSDQPGAVQPTHSTIVATLIVPQSGAGVVVVPTPTNLPVATPPPKPLSTTLQRSTGTSTRTTTSTSTSTTNTATASTSSEQVQDPPPPAARSSVLSTAQVAGISVGVAAALGIAIGAIFLSRHYRKRHDAEANTGFFPMRDSWEFQPGREPPKVFHVSPPILDGKGTPSPPLMPGYTRGSWLPETIGLAISAPVAGSRGPGLQRRNSRLLPAKPILSITIPKSHTPPPQPVVLPPLPLRINPPQSQQKSQPQPQTQTQVQSQLKGQPSQQPLRSPLSPQILAPASATAARGQTPSAQMRQLTAPPPSATNLRDSTMTEFEEDGGRDSASASAGGAIWRPPSAVINQSATMYYIADKYGNWVLGDPKQLSQRMSQIAELEAPTPTTAMAMGMGTKVGTGLARSVSTRATTKDASAVAGAAPSVPPFGRNDSGGSGSGSDESGVLGTLAQPQKAILAPAAEISRSTSIRRNNSVPRGREPLSRSSSIYSQNSAGPRDSNVPPIPFLPSAIPPPPRRRSRSNSLGRRRSSRKQPHAPERSDSIDSATTIASSTTGPFDEDEESAGPGTTGLSVEQQKYLSLSPVIESPPGSGSGGGKSPVSYPQIPGRLNSNTLRLVPPPKRPNFYSPPGQPSPTLGIMQPATAGTGTAAGSVGDGIQRGTGYLSSYDVPRKGVQANQSRPIYRPESSRPSQNVGPVPIQGQPQGQAQGQIQDYNKRPDLAKFDPGRFATGSPTMRLVEPSPPPEDASRAGTGVPVEDVKILQPPYQQAQSRPEFRFPMPPQGRPGLALGPAQRWSQQQGDQGVWPQYQYQGPEYQRPEHRGAGYQRPEYQRPEYHREYEQQQPRYQDPRTQPRPQPQRRLSQGQPQFQFPSPPQSQPQAQFQTQSQSQYPPPLQRQPQPQPQSQPQPPPQPQPQPQPQHQPSENPPPYQYTGPPAPALHIAHLHSEPSSRATSTASSLLAKRLGNDRAAAIAPLQNDPNAPASQAQKWRRQDDGAFLSPVRPDYLPSTPTWQPKLTPTRRGDDLFLNVQ